MTQTGPSNTEDKPVDADVAKLESLEAAHAAEKQKETPTIETASAQENQSTTIPPKKKRGRPPGSTNKSKDNLIVAPVLPPELVKLIIAAPYKVMAARRGDHWLLTEDEINNMVPSHMELANKYLPETLKEHTALVGVLAFHAMALYARVEVEMRLKQEDELLKPKPDESGKDISGEKRYGEIISPTH
jgi:hypothetical protein